MKGILNGFEEAKMSDAYGSSINKAIAFAFIESGEECIRKQVDKKEGDTRYQGIRKVIQRFNLPISVILSDGYIYLAKDYSKEANAKVISKGE